MKIMVVDDSNSARYVAVKALRDLGYKDIITAANPGEARPLIFQEKFDLIILDWNMPGMTGFEFLKELRSDPATEKLNIFMATTVNERNNVIQALKVGLQGYFFKPLTLDAIGPKIRELESKIIAERKN